MLPSGCDAHCIVRTASPAVGAASSVSHTSWMDRKASLALTSLFGIGLGEQLFPARDVSERARRHELEKASKPRI